MNNEFPIDIYCLYSIIIKAGKKDKIAEILKLKSIEKCSWKVANKKLFNHEKFDKIGHHELVVVSENILGWNFILCGKFYDLKYTLNCCNLLSSEFDEFYALMSDLDCGEYRFIKFHNGSLQRFFERDSEGNSGEFGNELTEEIEINHESEKHEYSFVTKLIEKLLRTDKWRKNKELFKKDVLIGKRYFKEIEKYLDIYLEQIDPKTVKNWQPKDDELPF